MRATRGFAVDTGDDEACPTGRLEKGRGALKTTDGRAIMNDREMEICGEMKGNERGGGFMYLNLW